MITIDKVIEIFCSTDEFCKNLEVELSKNFQKSPPTQAGEKRTRNRKGAMSKSEIMAILLYFHFGTFRNFKHYYLTFVKGYMNLFVQPNEQSQT